LVTVRHILNLAASEWPDEQDLTWLEQAPKIKFLPVKDGRSAHPLSREEQAALFPEFPGHLARMALFKVNTGYREQDVCGLKWEYEAKVRELETSVFIIPSERVKNDQDRLVVLNRIARSVGKAQRGVHPEYVFRYTPAPRMAEPGAAREIPVPRPVQRMNASAWRNARERSAGKWKEKYGRPARRRGFGECVRHDLKHTFGLRLRAADVSFEDRQDLLGHKSGRITTHYSVAELESLIAAAAKACEDGKPRTPTISFLTRHAG
jgi:integrase